MRFILGDILLATLFSLAPATAWAQVAPLSYTSAFGAATDISGGLYDGGLILCPPTVTYGQNAFGGNPPQQTGGDGVSAADDKNGLNAGVRTQATFVGADVAKFAARAVVSSDTSSPCAVFPNGSIFMNGFGLATTQFYEAYHAGSDPTSSRIDLHWRLDGSFSSLTTGGGGYARLEIYLLTDPPPQPVSDVPVVGGAIALVGQYVNSETGWANLTSCFHSCPPPPKASLIATSGRVDIQQAFESATGRPMTIGDSFIIGVLLTVQTKTCGTGDPCDPTPPFTTDFTASAKIKSEVVFPVFPQRP